MSSLFSCFQDTLDEDVRVIAMQVMVDICKREYNYVEFFFKELCQLTASAMRSNLQYYGAQGIEVWTTIAEEEHKKDLKGIPHKKYIYQSHVELIKMLLASLEVISDDPEEVDVDQWGISLSAGCCLYQIALVLGDEVVDPVIEYASRLVQDTNNWKSRFTALLALGAITEGPQKAKF